MLVLQAIAGLAMVAASGDVFPAAALVVVAGQLDDVPPRIAALWIAVQAVALAMIVWWFAPPVFALTIAGSFRRLHGVRADHGVADGTRATCARRAGDGESRAARDACAPR
jgi:hypothetical protein